MDLKAEFKSSFIRRPSLSAGISEYELLGHVYEKDPKDLPSQLPASRLFPTTYVL